MPEPDAPVSRLPLKTGLVIIQVTAIALVAVLAALLAVTDGMPGYFWALVAVMVAAWIAGSLLVVRPLKVMASEVGEYRAGDASATRAAVAEALAGQQRLTREVHHRVKNNLQIVSSLISIQARGAANADVARAYATIQIRVGALAHVHRWLYDDTAGQGVDLAALAHDLCAALQQGVGSTDQIELALSTSIERMYVSQDAAAPLAFIVTEIVAAAGHAHAQNSAAGPLSMQLALRKSEGGGELVIEAEPFRGEDRLSPASSEAPARIVNGMVRQLRGTIEHSQENGRYTIRFPLPAAV